MDWMRERQIGSRAFDTFSVNRSTPAGKTPRRAAAVDPGGRPGDDWALEAASLSSDDRAKTILGQYNREGAMPSTNIIRLVESNGVHWIEVIVDGCALERRGPFANASAAEATAIQFAAICGLLHRPMEIRP
jgi:hypothetical protein